MNFFTHNDKKINVNGTSLQGELSVTFEHLLKTFGTPLGASPDKKVDCEWHIELSDGKVATIYNWKNGNAYLGEKGKNPTEILNWNVGAKSKIAFYEIEEILEKNEK